jgi:hypothetical protein
MYMYHEEEAFQQTNMFAGSTICSASISNDGWAWFVIGRQLLVWQAVGNKHLFSTTCRELTLPPSDLAYSANLISVFTLHGNQVRGFVYTCTVIRRSEYMILLDLDCFLYRRFPGRVHQILAEH